MTEMILDVLVGQVGALICVVDHCPQHSNFLKINTEIRFTFNMFQRYITKYRKYTIMTNMSFQVDMQGTTLLCTKISELIDRIPRRTSFK